MPKTELEEQERIELLAYLETLLDSGKSLHSAAGAVMADVEAIRNAALDGMDEIAAFRGDLQLERTSTRAKTDKTRRCYDDWVMEVIESQRWDN